MRKVLPFCYPSITCWTWIAGPLAILESHSETRDWIYSNYANIYCQRDARHPEKLFVDFYPHSINVIKECPYLVEQFIYRDTFFHLELDNDDFIRNAINGGNYVYAVMNQKYFFDVEEDRLHETFIYGYNEEEHVYYVADFTFDDCGRYSLVKIEMDRVHKALFNVSPDEDFSSYIWLLKYVSVNDYQFERQTLCKELENYIEAKDSYHGKRCFTNPRIAVDNIVFGIQVFDALYDNVLKASDQLQKESILDIRAFHNMYDHKVMMERRVRYLYDVGEIRNSELVMQFADLMHVMNSIRLMVFRASLKRTRVRNYQKILKDIEICKVKERTLIENLLTQIREKV